MPDAIRPTNGEEDSSRFRSTQALDVAAPGVVPVLGLDQALGRLAGINRGLADIVELRAFGGLTIDEAAHVMNVSQSTAKREWRTAKAWLVRELGLTER